MGVLGGSYSSLGMLLMSFLHPCPSNALRHVLSRGFGSYDSPSLPERLQAVAEAIHPDTASVCDVGTDHGLLAIGLSLMGVERVIGVDVNPKPLQNALRNAKRARELSRSSLAGLEFRLGSLDVIEKGEVVCVAMAGLGHHTMTNILHQNLERIGLQSLVLQPVSSRARHLSTLRKCLHDVGWEISKESLVNTSGRHYVTFTAQRRNNATVNPKADDAFFVLGEHLLPKRDQHADETSQMVLEYWEHQRRWLEAILKDCPGDTAAEEELSIIERALDVYTL
jgi:tRNA A22 N-methylase